jgi:hypothetical protein
LGWGNAGLRWWERAIEWHMRGRLGWSQKPNTKPPGLSLGQRNVGELAFRWCGPDWGGETSFEVVGVSDELQKREVGLVVLTFTCSFPSSFPSSFSTHQLPISSHLHCGSGGGVDGR